MRYASSAVATFAAGAVLVFAALGVLVGALGADLGDAGRWVQRIAGVALVALAALFVLGRTGGLHRSLRLVRWLPASPQLRALALGAGCGAAWTPCAGPLLGAALTAAGGAGGAARSTVLLLAYATGVLLPFVALAAVGGRQVPQWMRRSGRVLSPVSAVVMMVLGVVLAAGWYDALVGRVVPG